MCDIAEAIRAVGRVQKHEVAVQQANIGRWAMVCAASVLVGVVLTGCNSSTGTDTPSGRIPTSLVMGAGVDGQVANVGSAVPTLPSVTVRDQDGRPLPGAVVLWAVRSGGGTVGFSSSAADSLGRASTSWVLGRTAGTQVLAALLVTGDSLRISATARALAPTTFELLEGDNQELAAAALSAPLVVRAQDTYLNPVANTLVRWQTSAGVLDADSVRTTAAGTASVRVTMPQATLPEGVVRVTARLENGASLEFVLRQRR
ncbi:MAG: Ig-like domain-containing protein [Gemmatimonadaceae bacterium]|nr:Ig-like domain-containing protein [Gemmatimonadaceae bacterium]